MKGHIILDGNKKVMFSAPHAVEQTRDGKTKFAEPETGEIVKLLNSLGYPCIIKTENLNDDANNDLECNYKKDLVEYIKNNKIVALIDLHEMAPTRQQWICLGTGGEKCLNLLGDHKKESKIIEMLSQYFDNVSLNNPFSASGMGTISRYMSECCNIPCVQIEINCKLFLDNIFTPKDMAKILSKMPSIMEKKQDEKTFIGE